MDDVDIGKWAWGELPSTTNPTPATTPIGFPSSSGRKTPAKGRIELVTDVEKNASF